MGSSSHLIQHVKLRQKTNLLIYDMNSLKDKEEDLKGDWVQVPQSKNSFLGHFLSWICISSYSACLIVYLYQLLCLYHKIHNSSYF